MVWHVLFIPLAELDQEAQSLSRETAKFRGLVGMDLSREYEQVWPIVSNTKIDLPQTSRACSVSAAAIDSLAALSAAAYFRLAAKS